MRILDLDKLKEGLPGITPVYGAFMAEAAAVILEKMGHRSGVPFSVVGDFEETFQLKWSQEIGDIERSSWGRTNEAVKFASKGISLLVASLLTGYEKFAKSHIINGYGAFIRPDETDDGTFSLKKTHVCLDTAGILKEMPGNTLIKRVASKKKQVSKYPKNQLPSYIVVVEFGTPKAKIVIQ